jgi:two-component system sensor histidine kinase HydH
MTLRFVFRMIAPTLAMSLVLLLLGGVAAWYLHELQKESSALLSSAVTEVRAGEQLEIIAHELRNELYQFLFVQEDPARLAGLSRLHSHATDWIDTARKLATTDEEKELIAQIDQGYMHFFTELTRVTQDPHVADHRQSILALVDEVTTNEILVPARRYRHLNQELMEAASQRNQTVANGMGLGLLLLGVCGAVAGLLAGYAIARGVQRSLVQLSVPIRDATGALSEVVGPITVSSEQSFEEMEAALQRMAERVATMVERLQEAHSAATRAERLAAMGQLAAGLAHELRNPLTSMKILIQSAVQDGDAVNLDTEDLTVLKQEITRLEHTIQTYLDYARPPKLEKSPFVLRQILQQTVDLVSHRATQLHVKIDCRLPQQVIQITADVGQIRQVLLNLLLNALDASPEGDTVMARMCYEFADGIDEELGEAEPLPRWVVIEIADNGSGLPPDLGDRIFEPFVSTKDGGTGLGLATCRRIVEDHGGQIVAVTRPEGGALFIVRLPVRPFDGTSEMPHRWQAETSARHEQPAEQTQSPQG